MAINTMGFNQLSTVLTSIVGQATGKNNLTATDTSSFVSVGKLGLETGYDPLCSAISQVLSKTIFSIRPYSSQFRGLEMDNLKYGNHVRKISFGDTGFEDDDRITLTDSYSIDQQVVKKPAPVQQNFYGENVYQKHITIFKDQMDVAFSGPEEFARFVSGVMQTVSDELEQAREDTGRMTLTNLIGGHYKLDNSSITTGCVVHLITEYNSFSGDSITAATVFNPDVFPNFAKWLYGRIATASRMLRERTTLHHLNLTGYDIKRHTPVERQRLYMLAQNMDQVSSNVLSSVFNDEYLRMIPRNEVSFWQSIKSPASINIKAGYEIANGTLTSANVSLSGIVFGVLMDEEAAGYTMVNQWSNPAPFNARGGYTNMYWHETQRFYNDFSENCVVFLLD